VAVAVALNLVQVVAAQAADRAAAVLVEQSAVLVAQSELSAVLVVAQLITQAAAVVAEYFQEQVVSVSVPANSAKEAALAAQVGPVYLEQVEAAVQAVVLVALLLVPQLVVVVVDGVLVEVPVLLAAQQF
jgi:hypothetical protein